MSLTAQHHFQRGFLMTKSIIDKTNKMWRWSKPSKKFKDWYKKLCGLEAKEVGIMDDRFYNMYLKLLAPDTAATSSGSVGAITRSSAVLETKKL